MTTLARKALNDAWQQRTRSVLVVLAMAVGIAAFSAVLSSYAILQRELNQGYLASHPASATLHTDAIDDELLRAVAARPEIAVAEARREVSGRLKAGPVRWRNLRLFVAPDFAAQRLDRLTPEGGAWPPGRGELLIERDAFQVAKTRVGETVRVRTAKGELHALRVAGGVHDVGQAQARMENVVYGYVTLETLADLGEEPILDELKILVAGEPGDREHVRRVTAQVRALVEGRGHAVYRVDVPEPGKHPHAALMSSLLLAIASFGLLVLALSGFLVVNLLSASMAAEVRQIGVMKAIGARRWQIAGLYFGQVLLLGMAAVAVALPAGVVGARLLCRYLASFLNFDLTSFATPWWVYALVALVGLAVPLLAAAYPVAQGSRVPVVAALRDFGVAAPRFGSGALDRVLAGVSGLWRPVLFAVRNSFRRRARLALTLLTLTAAGVFFLSALDIRRAMIATLDRVFAARAYDLSVNLGALVPSQVVERVLAQTPGAVRWEGWIVEEGSTGGDERFTVVGVPPATPLLRLELTQGRDLAAGDADALVVNTALAERHPELRPGERVQLRIGSREGWWQVVGVSREAFTPPVAYVPYASFARPGFANSLRVALASSDPEAIDRFRAALDRNLEVAGIHALSATSQAESRFGFDQHMVMIYLFLVVMSALIATVGGLGLATTMSLNVLERRREMGVLRAIGASSRMVWLIVVAEGVTIGALSFAIAVVVATPLSRALGELVIAAMFRSGLDAASDLRGRWIWLLVSLTLAALASFLPAWNASRSPVREALSSE